MTDGPGTAHRGPCTVLSTMARPIRRPGNLPAEATSFIGRRRELAELRTKLAAARLVTLVGPGGVGKTRLAIRGATELARAFPSGAWLVELADVRDPSLVQNAILAALDLRDQAATGPRAVLLSYLKDKELLLLVDNCEHLLDAAAALVADIVRVAPGVRVIATSREPLAVPGEHLLPVPPLELPRAAPGEPLELLRLNESVELFVERASAASGGFALTDANRAAVIEVCRRLDGLPLAIELAAVRTRVLAVEQIRDRLADRFGLLAGTGRGDAAAPPDAAPGDRVEPRPAHARRAHAPAAPVRVCRPVHARRRRGRVRRGRRAAAGCARPRRVARGQVAGDGRRGAGRCLLPPPRDDARVRPASAAGG